MKRADPFEFPKHPPRYYEIGGLTPRVSADLPITEGTFLPALRAFETRRPGKDMALIHHHFGRPDLGRMDLGRELYRRPPWRIYENGDSYIYIGISTADPGLFGVTVADKDYMRVRIHHVSDTQFRRGGNHSLTLFPTDQIILAPLLADRRGAILHSAGLVLDGQGLLFAGHSGAGKSTTVKMLADRAKILCDDRIIVRRRAEGFRLYGTWSHGEIEAVSNASAPLRAVLFLEKSKANRLIPIREPKEAARRFLDVLIRPHLTAGWWERSLDLVECLIREVSCYRMEFDKSGRIVPALERLAGGPIDKKGRWV
jgi:hypothetical protein